MPAKHLSLCILLAYAGFVLAASLPAAASAATAVDTTWVRTFDHDFYNWATPHVQTFMFPDSGLRCRQVLMRYRIECPSSPNTCDPWDRLGHLRVFAPRDTFEIARIVTPYSIGNRSCTWTLDVTDYRPILHDQVTLENYIETWINGSNGWIVTIDFGFIRGAPLIEPYRLVNLWRSDYAVYGDPARPIEDWTLPKDVLIDAGADVVKFRAIATGHGQGNTQNCTEFCEKKHTIIANGNSTWHYVWRGDCESNTCSPQGGSWTFDRAGWCPGDKVTPWDVDITPWVTPGETATLDYVIQNYENLCRPGNPSCPCTDCNYNANGHTEPIWTFQTQLVYYRLVNQADVGESDGTIPSGITIQQNTPNPFRPTTTIRYTVDAPGAVRLVIFDAGGRTVREITREHAAAGAFRILWDGRDDGGNRAPAGVYFYRVQGMHGESRAQRMLLLN
jgi:hypothetical protein